MPRSKRAKVVSLTKTEKKGREKKEKLVKEIQDNVAKWNYLWLFEVGKMRNAQLKDIRSEWKGTGRMFFGRVSVMAHALGTSPEHEFMPGLSKLANRMQGQIGLFFTSWDPKETLTWFSSIQKPDFARAGNIAIRTVTLPAGPIMQTSTGTPFPHAMEPQLRKLGLSTRMEKGVPSLSNPHVICTKGDKLTAEQAQLLKLRGEHMVVFRVALRCRWERETGDLIDEQGPLEEQDGTATSEGGQDDAESDEEDEEMLS